MSDAASSEWGYIPLRGRRYPMAVLAAREPMPMPEATCVDFLDLADGKTPLSAGAGTVPTPCPRWAVDRRAVMAMK